MITIAKAMTDEELVGGGGLLRLDEVDAVDQGRRSRHGAEDARAGRLFLKLDGTATEPIGNRIIEMPEEHRSGPRCFRDPRSGFIAYVPTRERGERGGARHDGGAGRTVRAASATART